MRKYQQVPMISVILFLVFTITSQQALQCGFGQFMTPNNECSECLSTCSKCQDLINPCPGCSEGQTLNYGTNQCKSCKSGQMACTAGVITCQPHYIYSNGQCIPQCKVANCQQCANIFDKTCNVCVSGYKLNANRTECLIGNLRKLQGMDFPSIINASDIIANINKQFDLNINAFDGFTSTLPSQTNQNSNTLTDAVGNAGNVGENANSNLNNPNSFNNSQTSNTLNTDFNNIAVPTINPAIQFPDFNSNQFFNQPSQIFNESAINQAFQQAGLTQLSTQTNIVPQSNQSQVQSAVEPLPINTDSTSNNFIPNNQISSFPTATNQFTSNDQFNSSSFSSPFGFSANQFDSVNSIPSGFDSFDSTPTNSNSNNDVQIQSNNTQQTINNIPNDNFNNQQQSTSHQNTDTIIKNNTQIDDSNHSTTNTQDINNTHSNTNPNVIIMNSTTASTIDSTPILIPTTIPNDTQPITCPVGTYLANGRCINCYSKCATCINSPDQCLECAVGWRKNGWKCIKNESIAYNFTLTVPNTSNSEQMNTTIYSNLGIYLNQFKNNFILSVLPQDYASFNASVFTLDSVNLNQTGNTLLVTGFIDRMTLLNLADLKSQVDSKLSNDSVVVGPFLIKSSKTQAYPHLATNSNGNISQNNETLDFSSRPYLAAILIPAILGGALLLTLITCLFCYCCKCCCFKAKDQVSPAGVQMQAYTVPTSTQRMFVQNHGAVGQAPYNFRKEPLTQAVNRDTIRSTLGKDNQQIVIQYDVGSQVQQPKQPPLKKQYQSTFSQQVVDYASSYRQSGNFPNQINPFKEAKEEASHY